MFENELVTKGEVYKVKDTSDLGPNKKQFILTLTIFFRSIIRKLSFLSINLKSGGYPYGETYQNDPALLLMEPVVLLGAISSC